MRRKLGGSEVLATLVLGAGVIALAMTSTSADEAEARIRTAWIVAIATGLLGEPLLVAVHELGHAVTAVTLTRARVLVQIGGRPSLVRFALGRIDIRFDPKGYLAHCQMPLGTTPGRMLAIAVAGPLASIVLAAPLVLAAIELRDWSPVAFWIAAVLSGATLFTGLANLVPFPRLPAWWPGLLKTDEEGPSDGWIAVACARAMLKREEIDFAGPETVTVDIATPAARRVLEHANDEADRADSPYLATEHLLVALAVELDGGAARTLARFGLSVESLRALLEPPDHPGPPPFGERSATPAVHRVLRGARSARSLRGDELVDTDHVLVSLMREPDGGAIELLALMGVDGTELARASVSDLSGRAATRRAADVGSGHAVPSA